MASNAASTVQNVVVDAAQDSVSNVTRMAESLAEDAKDVVGSMADSEDVKSTADKICEA